MHHEVGGGQDRRDPVVHGYGRVAWILSRGFVVYCRRGLGHSSLLRDLHRECCDYRGCLICWLNTGGGKCPVLLLTVRTWRNGIRWSGSKLVVVGGEVR